MKKIFTQTVLLFSFGLYGIVTTQAWAKANCDMSNVSASIYFSPNGGAADAIVDLIKNAKEKISLVGYSFTSGKIARALKEAHNRGIKVELILDEKTSGKGRYAKFLRNAGVPIYTKSYNNQNKRSQLMHHKFIIVDNNVGLGSMNFTAAGDERNADNFNIFKNTTCLTHQYQKEFDKLRKASSLSQSD